MTEVQNIERLASGVPGLDTILCGGFTKGGIHILQGPPARAPRSGLKRRPNIDEIWDADAFHSSCGGTALESLLSRPSGHDMFLTCGSGRDIFCSSCARSPLWAAAQRASPRLSQPSLAPMSMMQGAQRRISTTAPAAFHAVLAPVSRSPICRRVMLPIS
jgi:hypothetical protein